MTEAAIDPNKSAVIVIDNDNDPGVFNTDGQISSYGVTDSETSPEFLNLDIQSIQKIAEPLIDAVSTVQEIKYSLANLWIEANQEDRTDELLDDFEHEKSSTESSIGSVAINDDFNGVDEKHKKFLNRRRAEGKITADRPKWEEAIPVDDNDVEGRQRLKEALEKFPSDMRDIVEEHLSELRSANDEVAKLMSDPEILRAHQQIKPERYRVLHAAGQYGHLKRQSHILTTKASHMRLSAHTRQRPLSSTEEKIYERLMLDAEKLNDKADHLVIDSSIQSEVKRRASIERSEQLKNGFLETPRMKNVIDVVAPRLAAGLPAGFFGEIGGAKSALAAHISREYFGVEPTIVDCGPDVTMSQMFGSTGLKSDGIGGTESFSDPGEITRAAIEGRPVILEEFDTLPGRIRTALNGALLWRPGKTVRPFGMKQEIDVKPGFCIMVTANLKSSRYDREKMDISTLDRLQNNGAGTYEIGYPDADVKIADRDRAPVENISLAMAQLTNSFGKIELPSGLIEPDSEEQEPVTRLIQFVNAAHVIQRLFCDPTAINGQESLVQDSQHLTRAKTQGKPVLEEAVISPRGMLGILRNLQISGDKTTLSKELGNWISQQRVEMDRKIISTILASRGLLSGRTERDLKIPEGTLRHFMSSNV